MRYVRTFALVGILLGGLALAGCAANSTGAKLWEAVTTSVVNPVRPVNMYQAKLAYAAGQDGVKEYKLKCFGADGKKTFKAIRADVALSVVCNHRVSRYNTMKQREMDTYNAMKVADDFVAKNPSGNAASYISAAWKAATDFENLATAKK